MKIDINKYCLNIEDFKFSNRIWINAKVKNIYYPKGGHNECYELEEKSFWFTHRNHCLIQLLHKYSQDRLFFDIGGGNGYVSFILQKIGYVPILIEPGLQGAINAEKRGVKNIICSSVNQIEWKKHSLENIGLFDVLEHIEDDIFFLKKLKDIISYKGYLFLTVPAYNLLWSSDDRDAFHFRRYRLKQLEKKIKSVGFKIVYSTYIFSLLPLPILLLRTIPSLFRRKKKTLKNIQSEHQIKNKLLNKIMQKMLIYEIKRIKNGKKIFFGSSCLIVASSI